MIARFDLQFRHRLSPAAPQTRYRKQIFSVELWSIGILSVVFTGWLLYRAIYMPAWIWALHPVIEEFVALVELAGGLTLGILWGVMIWRRRLPSTIAEPPLSRDDLFALSPIDFERFVARLFRRKGYQVKLRGKSGDHGVDLELRKPGGKRAIVQCKRYRSQVGPDVVRELYGTLIHERVAHAFLVTTADISQASHDWVQGKSITLIDGDMLVKIATILAAEE